MSETRYRNRRAWQLEDADTRVTVTVEGGHVAEILHKPTGVNPLWTPPWPSIEPSTYDRARHPEYGNDAESKLLAGLMGHNLCLDLFGPPSPEEEAAGITVHGEASIVPYEISVAGNEMICRARLPIAQLAVDRRIRLEPGGVVRFTETVENLSALDRPAAWTEHVTLGPPFLEKGVTEFRAPAARSMTIEGTVYQWPNLPLDGGATEDLRVYTTHPCCDRFSAHLMDAAREEAFFLAYSPASRVLFGYVWNRADFAWLGMWDENYERAAPPWSRRTLTRGLEFGASPISETRRQMIDRHSLFDTPTYRWLPARTKLTVNYRAFIRTADEIPDEPPPR